VLRSRSKQRRGPLGVAALALGLSLVVLCLAACGGTTNATANGQTTTSTTKAGIVDAHPKGLPANAPLKITYGSGTIGVSDPTTTLPSEAGQAIQPGLNPGQNIIIKGGRALPQTLEASYGTPVVWYNLSGRPQRIIFNDYKFYPVDSGTIPPGATFTWVAPSGGPVAYTLEPSGFIGKVFLNPPSGGPGAGFGNSGGT
jgi:hypothetical protein